MNEIIEHPLLGITLTVLAYVIAIRLHRTIRFIHPILTSSILVILVLFLFRIPIASYEIGGDILKLVLGPATIALGVPIYKHRVLIHQHLKAILIAVTLGSITGIVSAAGLMALMGGTQALIRSVMPKSVSSPIAIELSHALGGDPNITALFTVITGLIGAIGGTTLLRKLGIRDVIAIGIAMGTAAHGFGTAKSFQDDELQGTLAGLAMGLAGVICSLLFIPILIWLG
ncbi:murein hydrolase effector protein LrgB [Paenibacillus selenitireducens]|uniref:Murein hydrolase effector protein LrgB n=1 Tax=Paenibacillus selenitireducens TaxID=1324314 RepID=A0A1T2XAJ0_9BACL|nr:LrgB family protein [Paenibacillus selenitireducens]OPA76911.1 murein hydrolase effector protein LrgB [Paenibacillus selenitireducens]